MKTQEHELIHPYVERTLKQIILKDLTEQDRMSTKTFIDSLKTLLQKKHNPALNSKVLVTAAYALNWSGNIERLLYQRLSSYFTEAEILRVVHLVGVHDEIEKLRDEDELLLFEAKRLGS